MLFPITKSRYKIIKHVYKTNGIKISKLLQETSVSQRVGYKHINALIKHGVLDEETIGSLRIIKPNLKSETGKLMYGLIEKDFESKLIKDKPELKDALFALKKGANNYSIESAILIGSFVKDHDHNKIDVLVICENNDKRILPFLQECFSEVEHGVSARILSKKGFKKFKRTKKDLYQESFKHHICIFNTHKFLELTA